MGGGEAQGELSGGDFGPSFIPIRAKR
jgi:hypothetical protein